MNQLEERLTDLLSRSAEAVDVRPDLDRILDAGSPTRIGPRPRALLPAAAIVLVVALVGAAVLVLRRDHGDGGDGHDEGGRTETVVVGDSPEGWPVPSWVPDGLEPWVLEWGATGGRAADGWQAMPQLFGDPDGGRAIYITSSIYEVRTDRAEDVTVRGGPGRAGPAWDIDEDDMGDAVTWDERGITLTALYRGMSRDDAIAVLDGLTWRTEHPDGGFAPPDTRSGERGVLPLRAEAAPAAPGRRVSLLYSSGPPGDPSVAGRPGLQVFTAAGGTISEAYLAAWYLQGAAARGGTRPLATFDDRMRQLVVVWPDGRSIDVTRFGETEAEVPDREELQRVADSLTSVSDAEMARLATDAGAASAALPTLAAAGTRIGTIEVHGQGAFLRLCRREPGADTVPDCPVDRLRTTPGGDGQIVSSNWTVDGTWYVVVASTGTPPPILDGTDHGVALDAGELPAELTTDGEWTFRLVEAPPGVDVVCTRVHGAVGCANVRNG